MRLNRVLLLAASFICMALAMVFTISCSGSDGKDGSLKSCILQPVEVTGGVNVVCEGTTLGTIPAGPKGDQGIKGDQGPAGSLPTGICTLGTLQENGKYSVICGGIDVSGEDGGITGSLETCTTEEGGPSDRGLLIIRCPESGEVYACGGQPFNPATDHCEMQLNSANARFEVPVIVASTCGNATTTYDSRNEFCDANVVRELCGTNKARYTYGAGETCVNGNVTKACGSSRYIKDTQFCMNNTTVQSRCGTAKNDGTYSSGSPTGDIIFGTNKDIGGGYNTASPSNELCLEGRVVKKCGVDQTYEEKTHFCGALDVVAPHCDDRVIYNPAQRFCSFVANPDYNKDSPACDNTSQDYDPDSKFCKEYMSTALVFCGTGSGAANQYNAGSWKWEYCVPKKNPDASSIANPVLYSVFRCAQNQIPNTSTGLTSETCTCLGGDNVSELTGGRNGCGCDKGFIYTAYKGDGNPIVSNDNAESLVDFAAIGTPLNFIFGNTSDGNIAKLSELVFSGGVCLSLPTCTEKATYCETQAACTGNGTNGTNENGVWDGYKGVCVESANDCSLKFGAYQRVCKTSRGTCAAGGDLDACLNATACQNANGYWDMYVISNQCVESQTDCKSRTANSNRICTEPALTCSTTSPIDIGTATGCITTAACTNKGGTVVGTGSTAKCTCRNGYEAKNDNSICVVTGHTTCSYPEGWDGAAASGSGACASSCSTGGETIQDGICQ